MAIRRIIYNIPSSNYFFSNSKHRVIEYIVRKLLDLYEQVILILDGIEGGTGGSSIEIDPETHHVIINGVDTRKQLSTYDLTDTLLGLIENAAQNADVQEAFRTVANQLEGKEPVINTNSLSGSKILNNSITTAKLVNAIITSAKIADNAVTNSKIANGAITSNKIADETKVGTLPCIRKFKYLSAYSPSTFNATVASDNVIPDYGYVKLNDNLLYQWDPANNRVNLVQTDSLYQGIVYQDRNTKLFYNRTSQGGLELITVPDGSITAAKIADGAINNLKLAANCVEYYNMEENAVHEDTIYNGSVTTNKIANKAVTAAKIADETITSGQLADECVNDDKLASGSVDTRHLKSQSVTAAKLATGAVETAKIADGAVTRDKIANDAVNGDKIADSSVDTEHIVNGAVTEGKIENGAVTHDKLSQTVKDYIDTQADWNQSNSSARDYIKNKPVVPPNIKHIIYISGRASGESDMLSVGSDGEYWIDEDEQFGEDLFLIIGTDSGNYRTLVSYSDDTLYIDSTKIWIYNAVDDSFNYILDRTAVGNSPIYYGTCDSTGSSNSLTVDCSKFELKTGATINVKFSNERTVSGSCTMNVGYTGAKSIKFGDSTTVPDKAWNGSQIIKFVYDGTYFVTENGKASTTKLGLTTLINSVISTDTSSAATPNSVKQAYDLAASKTDKMELVPISSVPTAAVNLAINQYYRFDINLTSFTGILPTVTENDNLKSICLYFTTGDNPGITFVSTDSNKPILYYDGYSIEANTTYEINIINLGTKWVLAYSIVNVPQNVGGGNN